MEPAKVPGYRPLPRVPTMSLDELFCDVDDFCRLFLPAWHRQLLTSGERKRQRASRLTLGEIMTILIYFHQSHYRNFKAFYLGHLCRYYRSEFPNLLSDSRCVAEAPRDLMPMFIALHALRGRPPVLTSSMRPPSWCVITAGSTALKSSSPIVFGIAIAVNFRI